MKIIVVGGGITGLSAAWYAKQRYSADITVVEKTDRLGGWIQTNYDRFFFEKGPRTFASARSPHLLSLIEELGLETVPSSPHAKKRFILENGKLKNAFFLALKCAPFFLREYFIKPSQCEDESIYEFASRRFGSYVAKTLFDPLTLGIYGGDLKTLSMRSCFPSLFKWEKQYGSILRGALSQKKSGKKGLFTIKNGMESLIFALKERLDCHWMLGKEVSQIGQDHILIEGKAHQADLILDARPLNFPKKSLWVVHLVYKDAILRKKGFGYLVPTKENLSLMGVIFDSLIFPSQGKEGELRLTAMVRPEEKNPIDAALISLKKHLNLRHPPIFSSAFLAKEAISQPEVGAHELAQVSVDACIQRGKEMVYGKP